MANTAVAPTSTPKYIEVRDYILALIDRQELAPGDKLPTEKALCDKFGVSRVTVNNALGGLQKLGKIYRVQGGGSYIGPRAEPVEKKSERTADIIPFIISDKNPSTRYLETIKGIEDSFKTKNKYVTVHSPNGDLEEERAIINNLLENNIRTLIIRPLRSDCNVQFYFNLLRQNVQLVFVDFLPAGLTANLVTSDNVMGGYLVTRHLLGRGYHRIAVLTGGLSSQTTIHDRLNGYQFALSEAGLVAREEYRVVVEGNGGVLEKEKVRTALKKLMAIQEPPDALFCINDMTAATAYTVLEEIGLRVPEDIALTGFDNLPVSQTNKVPITTVEQSFYNMGMEAGRLAYELMTGPPAGYIHRLLPVKLLERDSSSPSTGAADKRA